MPVLIQIMPNDLKKIFYIVLFTHKGCEEMISKMSRGIVEFLLKEDTIDNEDKEIYANRNKIYLSEIRTGKKMKLENLMKIF